MSSLYKYSLFLSLFASMATSLEHVLQLFDSVWFHNKIFQEKHDQNRSEERSQILKVRSHSESLLLSSSSGVMNFLSDSQSPTSVLQTPSLQTIFSGKEVSGFDKVTPAKISNKHGKKQRRGVKRSSKSLTELEFEELKGFKDLGFVFSEEDTEDGELALIVPGLQRLRRRRSESDENGMNVERPYLSEAWSVMERNEALMKPVGSVLITMKQSIRESGMKNELLMKEQIKSWAHSVATAIR